MDIAIRLDFSESRSHDNALIRDSVLRWLETSTDWLIVFDNADTPDFLHPIIVGNSRGHYLLTTRQSALDSIGVASPMQIGVMSKEDAIHFLLTRTNRPNTKGEELSAADQIAEELGRLPLALEQAASYILSRKTSFVGYLISYRTRRLELLAKSRPVTGDYASTVSTTWSLNFEAVRAELAASAELLEYVAFLDPDDIPFELIAKGAKLMGGEIASFLKEFYVDHDELTNPRPRFNSTLIDDLLYPLIRYSLIDKFPEVGTFSIHRLVQEVIKADLNEGRAVERRATLINVLADAFPIVDFEAWQQCSRLLLHVMTLVAAAQTSELKTVHGGDLLHRTAHYLGLNQASFLG